MHTDKEFVRLTFDCPIKTHTITKMRATALHKSMKDQLIDLMNKDIVENPIEHVDDEDFRKEMKKSIRENSEIIRRLSNR